MKGKIDFFQKCVAFLPCQPGMRTSSLEGVVNVIIEMVGMVDFNIVKRTKQL